MTEPVPAAPAPATADKALSLGSIDVTSPFGHYALPMRHIRLLNWAQGMRPGWWGRRAALLLRRAVLRRGYAVIDAAVDGIFLRLYMKDNVSERKFLFMPQFFDRFERGLIRAHLPADGVFVDIGANAGIYALTAASCLGPQGRVLAVEPNPMVLDRLKFNMALNGFDGRMLIEQAAVSDAEGTFDLTLDDGNLGGSSLVSERSSRRISVRCSPLLDILHKYGIAKIDILKIDIEGAEDKALLPFFATAPEALYPRYLIIENSPKDWRQDLPGGLEKAGYALLRTTRMNLVFQKK